MALPPSMIGRDVLTPADSFCLPFNGELPPAISTNNVEQ